MLYSTILILAIASTTCSNPADKSGTGGTLPESLTNASRTTGASKTDSLITGKAELAKIYSLAIAEYIEAVYKKDKSNFDTIFIGKQIDFPDMDLPAIISGVKIHVLAQEEINGKKSTFGQSSPYINLIGFVENDQAEFIFVTFYPGFYHQYDCYMDFRYSTEKKEFYLNKSRIEVLIRDNEGKADHYAVYEDGKHIGDKPIDKK